MPESNYRETITRVAEAEYAHKKQIGGGGEFAIVRLRLEPLPSNSGIVFVSEVDDRIPRDLVPGIEACLLEAATSGGIYGFPVIDVRVTLLDGAHHEIDSNKQSFAIATENAFRLALRNAAPIVLEKIVKIVVETPDDFIGGVIGELVSRRGRITGVSSRGDSMEIVEALVPLSKLDGYAAVLQSITVSGATFTMTHDHWERCPDYDPDPKFPGAMAMRIAR